MDRENLWRHEPYYKEKTGIQKPFLSLLMQQKLLPSPGMDWSKLNVLVTGGTGSFGKAFISTLLKENKPKRLVIFSRDELKQHEMQTGGLDDKCLRYFIGDVRDKERLSRAMQGIDIVVHAAALKHVPACEYNPIEAVKTNVLGAQNLIETTIDSGVQKVLALSTDKAVNPVNLYGATKLVAEKVFIQGNAYSGATKTFFSCARYGNVVGSRGSVVPLFYRQRDTGTVTITDERMTRFWLTLDQGVQFVLTCIEKMKGGEIFVPKIPSMKMVDLADSIAPNCKRKVIGIRPGEKLHEALISDDEARHSVDVGSMFVILPENLSQSYPSWKGKSLPDGFRYTSDTNKQWLTKTDLAVLLGSAVRPSGEGMLAPSRHKKMAHPL